ncbi:DUF2975 domain-containing protein [Paenibacillus ihuae]|uniref:DUF2975 domain-containing protein n=1 Tax=Paenibacillus ihuae TaxID=1232431 RepID=UPI0006D568FB|nr:DUF2975 domain-containing protein [Paenibacillus ihuae]
MKQKNETAKKINHYTKVTLAVWYFVLGAGIFMFIAASVFIGLHYMDKLPLGHLVIEFTTPGLQINVDSKLLSGFSTPAIVSIGMNILATWILLLYLVRQFSNIFKSFLDHHSPFIMNNVYRLRHISYSFFLYSAVILVLGIILKQLFTQDFLLPGTEHLRLHIRASIPFWPILCGIFAMGMAEIFHYGLKLQQDNDSIV